jgi:two-component system phosphate regulon sensor histidine kinase PhoR
LDDPTIQPAEVARLHSDGMRISTDSKTRFTYDLPLSVADPSAPASAAEGAAAGLQEALLIGNVLWFARLRWMAISALAVFGAAGLIFRDLFPSLGLRPPIGWPFLIAALLLLANLVFLSHARRIARNPSPRTATWNLWTQIVVDLLALTMVVHFLGSLETVTPFLYLAHIVLACIFFSRRQSLVVVVVASSLYVACVGLEHWQIVSVSGIYLDPRLRQGLTSHPALPWLTVLSALGIYFVVWFLASHLSGLVRGQEVELAEANRRLTIAQQEKTRHMLRTTHELKAPFAAIAANAQLLLRGHCGVLPDAATEVVRRIALRCRRLAVEIQEMLQLANLQSADSPPQPARLDLAEIARWAIARVGAVAQERRVRVDEQLASASVVAVEDHLKMLLTNIVSNAVVYSAEGGIVRVRCDATPPEGPVVTVEDEGIGIPQEKLPRIFDEYYRTEEAIRHNKDSTGLGLAIVRHVAVNHAIRVRVESAPGRGTRFTLHFPSTG